MMREKHARVMIARVMRVTNGHPAPHVRATNRPRARRIPPRRAAPQSAGHTSSGVSPHAPASAPGAAARLSSESESFSVQPCLLSQSQSVCVNPSTSKTTRTIRIKKKVTTNKSQKKKTKKQKTVAKNSSKKQNKETKNKNSAIKKMEINEHII